MKANRRQWTATEKCRYVEVWLAGLPAVISATAKPLACVVMIIAILSGESEKAVEWVVGIISGK